MKRKEFTKFFFKNKGVEIVLKRVSKLIKFPVELIELIEEYKEKNHLTSFTAALLELVRKGLDS